MNPQAARVLDTLLENAARPAHLRPHRPAHRLLRQQPPHHQQHQQLAPVLEGGQQDAAPAAAAGGAGAFGGLALVPMDEELDQQLEVEMDAELDLEPLLDGGGVDLDAAGMGGLAALLGVGGAGGAAAGGPGEAGGAAGGERLVRTASGAMRPLSALEAELRAGLAQVAGEWEGVGRGGDVCERTKGKRGRSRHVQKGNFAPRFTRSALEAV